MVFLDTPSPIEFTGWFFIVDRTCIDNVGYFDEQFTYFGEDDDYFHRYKMSGLKYAKVKLDVFHHGSKTVNQLKDKESVRRESIYKLIEKYPHIKRQV